jgi:1-acyl-sn-glycerol-3-phosphate acyltransferase
MWVPCLLLLVEATRQSLLAAFAHGYRCRVRLLSEMFFRLTGWVIEGNVPDEPKLVIIAYPHTSNWDLFVFFAIVGHFGLKVRFLAHEGLFVGPFAWLLHRWGAIPVQRGAGSAVATAIGLFDRSDSMLLVVAPEGTRAAGSGWKSGFWRIADAADVPVLMGFVDRDTKRMGFGPALKVDGDAEGWMEQARVFYEDKRGLKPANRGPLELGT